MTPCSFSPVEAQLCKTARLQHPYLFGISQQCPAGTFSSAGQASCTPCSPGTYCPTPGNTQDGAECPIGHFCGQQTIIPQPCKPGTFQDQPGQSSCKLCPRGVYCPNYRASAATDKCYAGTICVAGATHPRIIDHVYSFEDEMNGLCPPGHFCKAGVTKPTPCPEGQYQVRCLSNLGCMLLACSIFTPAISFLQCVALGETRRDVVRRMPSGQVLFWRGQYSPYRRLRPRIRLLQRFCNKKTHGWG